MSKKFFWGIVLVLGILLALLFFKPTYAHAEELPDEIVAETIVPPSDIVTEQFQDLASNCTANPGEASYITEHRFETVTHTYDPATDSYIPNEPTYSEWEYFTETVVPDISCFDATVEPICDGTIVWEYGSMFCFGHPIDPVEPICNGTIIWEYGSMFCFPHAASSTVVSPEFQYDAQGQLIKEVPENYIPAAIESVSTPEIAPVVLETPKPALELANTGSEDMFGKTLAWVSGVFLILSMIMFGTDLIRQRKVKKICER